ncbi:MAG: hypothetical protein ACFFDN_52410 [Candidatus Hodarchaeota archaeon]
MKKHVINGIISMVLIISFFGGCITDLFTEKARIISFKVNPSRINYGETSNLSWIVENADTVIIDNEIGKVDL